MKFYLGIDVSKDKIDCLWLKDPELLKVKTKVLPNSSTGFNSLQAWCEKIITRDLNSIHVTMEATSTYHEALAYALYDLGFQVSVVNPAQARDFARGLGVRNKTDKKDSQVLARFGAMTNPRLWHPEPEAVRTLKALISRLSALEADLQREKNRLEKVQISQGSEIVIESIQTMVDHLIKECARVEKQIDDHIDQNPQLKQDRARLQTITGVGQVVSREMLCVLHSRQFKKASEAAAFVGLVPKLHESGKLKGRTTLSKQGSAWIRAKLYMAAVVSIQYNPDIKNQYQRLLKAGKTKMQALGAAMRKLVHICFGVIKHQTQYRPQCVE